MEPAAPSGGTAAAGLPSAELASATVTAIESDSAIETATATPTGRTRGIGSGATGVLVAYSAGGAEMTARNVASRISTAGLPRHRAPAATSPPFMRKESASITESGPVVTP